MKKVPKSIYDKLDNLKAPINKKQSWDELYNRDGFPKKERKRRFFFWYFLGIAALLLIISILISRNSNIYSPTKKEVVVGNAIIAQNESVDKTLSFESNKSNQPGQTLSQGVNSSDTKTNNLPIQESIETGTKLDKETNDIHRLENKSLNKPLATEVANQQILDKKRNSLTTVKKSNLTQNTEIKSSLTKVNSSIQDGQIQDQISPIQIRERQISLLSFLQMKTTSFIEKDKLFLLDSLLLTEKFALTELDTILSRSWALEVGMGIGSANHSIINDTRWEDQFFQIDHTKSLISYMLDLRITKKFRKNWRMAIGVRYSNNRRVFSYEAITKEYIRQDRSYHLNYLESTISTKYKFYHQHHMIDLTTLLFRDFAWNKTTAYAGIGLGVNTLHRFNQKGIDSNLQEIDLKTIGNYKNSIGLHFLYEIGISQQLMKRYSIRASVIGKSLQGLNTTNSHRISPVYFRVAIGVEF